jgi:hypothetical protein
MKKETLEEAFEKWDEQFPKGYDKLDVLSFGAKWQQERSYSEEEVLELLILRTLHCKTETKFNYINTKKWFEQFKKK